MTPGWRSGWYIGVRATQSRKLVASICGVPNKINVRGQSLLVAEINFLCIHKKLRSKRLAPLLIKEVTRRCCLDGVYQAIYTAKDVLSTPIGTCQSYHRPLNWVKLYEAGFISHTYIPSKTREAAKYRLPDKTSTPRLRAMQTGDIDAVWCLLGKYLRRFHLYPVFSREDISHWLHATGSNTDQIIWPYVVEAPGTKKITEFVSFYGVDAKVLLSFKHSNVRMASLYYYASETAFTGEENGLQERLQMLINDALILAKNVSISAKYPTSWIINMLMQCRLGLTCSMRSPSMTILIFLND
jgi:glycylpeptide N-tetradecanoyltransferase